jgi:hypothetical protein
VSEKVVLVRKRAAFVDKKGLLRERKSHLGTQTCLSLDKKDRLLRLTNGLSRSMVGSQDKKIHFCHKEIRSRGKKDLQQHTEAL